MATSKKIFTVQNLAEKFKQAKALVLADYSGLNVNQLSELRRKIKKAGGEFEVVKNSLLLLAAKTGLPRKFAEDEPLGGPTAALWLYQEDFTPLKTLDVFIQKNQLPKLKFGFLDGDLISPERIKELANLPGLEELRAKLVGSLKSPLLGLTNSINFNLWKLVMILKEVNQNGRRKETTKN